MVSIKRIFKGMLIALVGFFLLLILIANKDQRVKDAYEKGKEAGNEQVETQSKPKISFSGSVEPSTAKRGEKIVITFEVENLDDSRTIDGMRILFANKDFVTEGLTIVNVMSGGIQDGRAFEWTNNLMQIKPNEKRNFVIVASAKDTGRYESVVTFVNPTGKIVFDDQGQELKASLVVLP